MNILLTGATGFIGSNLLYRLTGDGHHVRCLVRSHSAIDKFSHVSNIELFYGDISDQGSLTDICKGINIVIHAAGILGRWNSTVADLRPVNANGIRNLAQEMLGSGVEYIIHLSAGGVTGPVTGGPADETYRCQPRTPYEITKCEGEKNALSLYENYELPLVIVRPTFTYGPGDPHKLPLFRTVKKGRFFFVGSGQSTNHPVYIDDLVSGIMLLLEKRPMGEKFIIGGTRPVSKKELIHTIAQELGATANFLHAPRWLASLGAFGMVSLAKVLNFDPILTPSRVSMLADNYGYSIAKARQDLGYLPQTDLQDGIRSTVESYTDLGWL
jgi:dihydroflavonol-4-reductase